MLFLRGIKRYLDKTWLVIFGMFFGAMLTIFGKGTVTQFLLHYSAFSMIMILTFMQVIRREDKNNQKTDSIS